MKLYNSLTKEVEEFTPLEEGKVRLYSCGPTVYDNLHIGNLSAFIYVDLLRRVLSNSGYEVTAVMNITDVDDKTIRDSKRDYPELEPMQALQKLTKKYEQVFKDDTQRIGNDTKALTFIRATETIPEMLNLIQRLLDKNIAYWADDGIYFSIKQYELAGFTYGKLQKIDRDHESARVANDEYDKDSASDFALWKRQEDGEPAWDASFIVADKTIEMPGRPGWHIECSAMSEKLLGVPFDIHTGGIDLKFPHHENEIAQSCGATSQPDFAKYFVHNNHILIDGKKMSKSLNNFYTLREIEDKGFKPEAFRVLVLSSHYRNESNFTWEILEAAQNRLSRWRRLADQSCQVLQPKDLVGTDKAPKTDEEFEAMEQENPHFIKGKKLLSDFQAALEDDLNSPRAIAAFDQMNDIIETEGLNAFLLTPYTKMKQLVARVFGIDLFGEDITDQQKQLIAKREEARQAKDWSKSDELRDQLKSQGLEINDTPRGPIWSRTP